MSLLLALMFGVAMVICVMECGVGGCEDNCPDHHDAAGCVCAALDLPVMPVTVSVSLQASEHGGIEQQLRPLLVVASIFQPPKA